uniref:AhpC/TSA family protein n=1 Tax=Promethearchaeum syntrophicum TaxID=2594042 RepID=A0A5B9DBY9_9ARCH|nr:AhpC/TSA family protein [Candidatus Prometheoarchaeum syntrophicum]
MAYERFQALKTEIIPILVDNLKNVQKMESKYAKGKFPILYDEKNFVAKKLHQEVKLLKLGRLPGMLIVDKQGLVQYAYYGDNMADIPKNRDVLEILATMQS